jgi:histone deacetylase 1/2
MSHRQLHDTLAKGSPSDREECLNAIAKEYNNFDKRCLWKCCPLPPGAALHRMILLGKVKNTAAGVKSCVKFRSVVDGAGYVPGRDCGFDTYAPCPQMCTARCMIHDSVINDKCCKSCDVAQAFTFGCADRRVFVKCPPGRKQTYGPDGNPLVYEIVGNCYGSPSAPSRWHACLYIKNDLNVLVYIDDCLATYPETDTGRAEYASFIQMMTTKFALGDDGFQDCTDYIGMHLEWNADHTAVVITQPDKVQELLSDANLDHCRPSFTPGIPKTLISDRDCPSPDDVEQKRAMATKPYRRRIGQLLWIARSSRPDIAYQVNALARVAHNPGLAHWKASTLLLRYVVHTRHMGLVFRKDPSARLCLWSDATWAPDYGTFYDNYRSTTGWCATSGYNLLNWNSHRQAVVAQSSAESEWYAAADAAKEAEFLKNLLTDMGMHHSGPVPLLCDNQSTIKQTLNAVDQRSSRHLGMRSHFLRQQCHAGDLELQYVPTQNQLADLCTKCLPAPTHEQLRHSLGVLSPDEFHSLKLPRVSSSSPSEAALKMYPALRS